MKEKGKSVKVYLIGMILGGIAIGVSSVIADTIINSQDVSYKTTSVKTALDDLYGLTADDVWEKIYPVGSIYTSVLSTSPEELFGGEWEVFGEGRTLVGVDEDDSDFSTSENVGGEKVHTLTAAESGQKNLGDITSGANSRGHTHSYTDYYANTTSGSTTLTINQIPSHGNHLYTSYTASGNVARYLPTSILTAYGSSGRGWTQWSGGEVYPAGRSLGGGGGHTHSVSNTSTSRTSGGENQNHTHTVTISGSDATSGHNNLQPYITVYMWKRTA